MQDSIRTAILDAIQKLGVSECDFVVEHPADATHGEYATNVALSAARALKANPREVASRVVAMLEGVIPDVARIEIAGPGFINFHLTRAFFAREIERAVETGATWGSNTSYSGKKVMIEYSNPNPFKEIHIGHLMSNVIGESLSRLIALSGATVLRDTFGGDVGPHVAKAIWALKEKGVTQIESAKQIGEAYIEGSNAYEMNPEVKDVIDALNTKIYDIVGRHASGDSLATDESEFYHFWEKGRSVSMEEFARIFATLGTSFDYIFFDSDTTKGGIAAVLKGLESGIFEKSDGAIVYRGEKKGLHTLVFITSRGTPTYETKDIGLALLKEETCPVDEVLIVTAVEQVGHFKVVLAALEEMAPELAAKTHHVPHGLLQLTTGKMSSRKGNVITASDLIDETIAIAAERSAEKETAHAVGIGAIKYMILRQAAGGNIIYDTEKSLSLEGDSGPYLQYAHTRAVSVLKKAEDAGVKASSGAMPEIRYDIERLVYRFPEVVLRATKEREPHHVATYLTELAAAFNAFYAHERIADSADVAAPYKAMLTDAVRQTLHNGLYALGIPVPERM